MMITSIPVTGCGRTRGLLLLLLLSGSAAGQLVRRVDPVQLVVPRLGARDPLLGAAPEVRQGHLPVVLAV